MTQTTALSVHDLTRVYGTGDRPYTPSTGST